MAYDYKNDDLDTLFEAVLSLNTLEECYDFFVDLCTVPELKSFAQRFKVAKMLLEGKVYSEIVLETGASTATISRVNRSLHLGNKGYEMALAKLENKAESEE